MKQNNAVAYGLHSEKTPDCKPLMDSIPQSEKTDCPPFQSAKAVFNKVAIVMGSDSDLPVMKKAADILNSFGVAYEIRIISAHREPDNFFEYAKTLADKGIKVVIAGAGMAAHLPGMFAAVCPLPVIGVPMHTKSLGGKDSLYSIVQMPPGIPVATVAIDGGLNAGLLAAKILSLSDKDLRVKLDEYAKDMKKAVEEKDFKLRLEYAGKIC